MDDLKAFSIETEIVEVTSTQRMPDGRTVTNKVTHEITPFRFAQFFKVLAHLEAIFKAISNESINLDDPLGVVQMVVKAMSVDDGKHVLGILSIATGRDIAYFDTLMPDDGIRLATAVFKVNKDFFVQKALPLLPRGAQEAAASGLDGQTQ